MLKFRTTLFTAILLSTLSNLAWSQQPQVTMQWRCAHTPEGITESQLFRIPVSQSIIPRLDLAEWNQFFTRAFQLATSNLDQNFLDCLLQMS